MALIYCPDCGRQVSDAAPQCPHCGRPIAGRHPVRGRVPAKSKLAAALLAFFLGGLGIHKFYLGRPFQGLLYLLFFWTLIPMFVAFVEGILYLVQSDDAFAASYGALD